MQSHNWNDLKHFLALYRTGKLKEAGRALGTSETTVTRRIRSLEQELSTSLFVRSANGRYEPTDTALRILSHAEAIEMESLAIREKSGERAHDVTGCVRISSVPIIVNRVLVPNLGCLTSRHPHLTVELVPASDNLDLSKREADLAIRFARPANGGLRTKAQKLGEMQFGAYAASKTSPERFEMLGWITYDETRSELPQARWLEVAAARASEPRSRIRVADAETALEAVAEGLGKSLFPRTIADAEPRLRALPLDTDANLPVREVWLLAHVDQISRSSIVTAKEWLTGLLWS